MMDDATTMLPLRGVRVVDFSELLPSPFLTRCLAEMGAELTKIESPRGDGARTMSPGVYAHYAKRKKTLTLDLKDEAQSDQAWQLIANCEVVVGAK